jgi:hypothetical protein
MTHGIQRNRLQADYISQPDSSIILRVRNNRANDEKLWLETTAPVADALQKTLKSRANREALVLDFNCVGIES